MTENLVGGKVFVSPNGQWKVRVFRHGFVAPIGDIPVQVGETIQEMTAMARERLGDKVKAHEIFEFMGWVEAK